MSDAKGYDEHPEMAKTQGNLAQPQPRGSEAHCDYPVGNCILDAATAEPRAGTLEKLLDDILPTSNEYFYVEHRGSGNNYRGAEIRFVIDRRSKPVEGKPTYENDDAFEWIKDLVEKVRTALAAATAERTPRKYVSIDAEALGQETMETYAERTLPKRCPECGVYETPDSSWCENEWHKADRQPAPPQSEAKDKE